MGCGERVPGIIARVVSAVLWVGADKAGDWAVHFSCACQQQLRNTHLCLCVCVCELLGRRCSLAEDHELLINVVSVARVVWWRHRLSATICHGTTVCVCVVFSLLVVVQWIVCFRRARNAPHRTAWCLIRHMLGILSVIHSVLCSWFDVLLWSFFFKFKFAFCANRQMTIWFV